MLTERQWTNRIRQRRELVARASELEERICAALEARSASLDDVRSWLSEASRIHEKLQGFAFSPFASKRLFTDDDLVARLGNTKDLQKLKQRRAEADAEKAARDLTAAQRYEAERLSHPKLAQPPVCLHPERAHCDYYGALHRCEFMEYGGTPGYWLCNAGNKEPRR